MVVVWCVLVHWSPLGGGAVFDVRLGKQRNSVTLRPITRTIKGKGPEYKAYKEGLELVYRL